MKKDSTHSCFCIHSDLIFQSLERVLLFYSSAHLLGVDETVAAADIGYFYGAVSVGGESR